MKIARLDVLFASAMLVLSLYMIAQSLFYGIAGDNITGSGFFPLISGAVILICSIGVLIDGQSRAVMAGQTIGLKQLKPVIGITSVTIAYILLIPVLGMIPLTLVYIPAVAYCIQWPARKAGHFTVAAIALVATICFYVLFDRALHIPVPWGIWR